MYCDNCGKNYANVRYTQIINGNKREMFLCEACSKIFGIENFNMTMDFSTFLEDFFTGFEEENIFPKLLNTKEIKCKRCNSTFEDFINTGRFGCQECYGAFEEKIDLFLRNIQGANRHIGRLGKINDEVKDKSKNWVESEKTSIKETTKLGQINELKKQLKIAINEEKYEDAASLRDKIKELEGEN